MSFRTFEIVRGIVLLAIALGAIGWFFYWCLKRSEDPARLILKWVLTVPVICFLIFVAGPMAGRGDLGAVMGVPSDTVSGG